MVHRLGQQRGDLAGKLECAIMTQPERRGIRVRQKLLVDRIGDLGAAMAGRAAEQCRRAVDHLIALVVGVIDTLALGNQARVLFELAVASERHPMFFQRVCAARIVQVHIVHGTTPSEPEVDYGQIRGIVWLHSRARRAGRVGPHARCALSFGTLEASDPASPDPRDPYGRDRRRSTGPWRTGALDPRHGAPPGGLAQHGDAGLSGAGLGGVFWSHASAAASMWTPMQWMG